MKIQKAKIADVDKIYDLINYYAEMDRMLFREKANIYENLQTFVVASDENNNLIGCCSLQVIWRDLAEIKSLAVDQTLKGSGIGKKLVNACLESAKDLGIKNVMALTLENGFFEKLGFERVDKRTLPMKVWSDCSVCPKQDHCDETAYVIKTIP